MRSIRCVITLALVAWLLAACTTVQTTYFRNSYHALLAADDPALQRQEGQPEFVQVADMGIKADELWRQGHALLGYSQFVSPLLTSLAPDYASKWGAEVGAAHVVMETPLPAASNLHAYLVSYWARFDPAFFTLGAHLQEMPEEMLARIGREMNLVMVVNVIPGTPAARAGLRVGDVIVGADGERMPDARTLLQRVAARRGQAITLNLTRRGEEIDLPVMLAAPPEGRVSRSNWQNQPWLATVATDWSSLSIANLAASNMAATMQRIERDRELQQERARVHAQRNLQALNSSIAANDAAATNRRGGGVPQGRPTSGHITPQQQQAMWKTMSEWGRELGRDMDRQRLRDMNLFFDLAWNPYGRWGR